MNVTHETLKLPFGLLAAGLTAVVGANGCATDAGGAFSSSLTPTQYAQISTDQCSGVPSNEREQGVLAYREAIASAQPLKETYSVGKTTFTHERGVQIAMRAEPSMTAPWLKRVATCHVALVRSGLIAANPGDPQAVAGASVHVEEANTGFVVSVRVPDDVAAAEVMRRVNVALGNAPAFASAERLAQ